MKIKEYIAGWSLFRLLRLAIGIFILYEGIQSGELGFLLLGAVFTILPLLNIGCGCTQNSCSVPIPKSQNEK